MRPLTCFLMLFVGGVCFFVGRWTSGYILCLQYDTVKSNVTEVKVFIEVIYYLLASCLIPLAYIQYRSEKNKNKKGDVQFAHSLYQIFVRELLPRCEKCTPELLELVVKDATGKEAEKDNLHKFNQLVNDLDSFAAAFVHGLADSASGKSMMGTVYCNQIDKLSVTLKKLTPDNYQEGLENIFLLHNKWKEANGENS